MRSGRRPISRISLPVKSGLHLISPLNETPYLFLRKLLSLNLRADRRVNCPGFAGFAHPSLREGEWVQSGGCCGCFFYF